MRTLSAFRRDGIAHKRVHVAERMQLCQINMLVRTSLANGNMGQEYVLELSKYILGLAMIMTNQMVRGTVMSDIQLAIQFVRDHGNKVEHARLNVLLQADDLVQEAVQQLKVTQRADGSWAPFWVPDASSLDATCYRLAQSEQLGINPDFDGFYLVQLVRDGNSIDW